MARTLPLYRLALFSLAPCVLLLGLLEAGSRLYETKQPPQAVDFSGGFSEKSRVFVPDPQRPGTMHTNPAKLRVFQPQSFAQPKPASTFRIAALGESSVFHLQSEFATLAAKLSKEQKNGKTEILNAGGQSYGSERLLLVAKELLEYSPDMLFIYIGHNEFEEAEQLALIRPELSGVLEYAFENYALVRLTVTALSQARIRALREQHKMRLLSEEPNTARAWNILFSSRDVSNRMRSFRANLSYILELYKSLGIPVLLSTVPSNLVKPYLPPDSVAAFYPAFAAFKNQQYEASKTIARQVLRDARGRHQSSDLENEILRDLALQHQIPLLDVEALITEAEPHKVPGETLFSDHCHLNSKGNHLLAEALLESLRSVVIH